MRVANNNQLEAAFRKKDAVLITIKGNPTLPSLPLRHIGHLAGMWNLN